MHAPYRTADERFLDLPGYAYAPCYVQNLTGFEGLRLHYLTKASATQRTPGCACMVNQPGLICIGR